MQIFYINEGSVLPTLRVELINDGRYDFIKSSKYNNAIQNADVTFTMTDENDILRISNKPCRIVLSDEGGCEDRYIIEYKWTARDTKRKGQYKGRFTINFKDDLKDDNYQTKVKDENGETRTVTNYPSGNLIMPIYEDLEIMIK